MFQDSAPLGGHSTYMKLQVVPASGSCACGTAAERVERSVPNSSVKPNVREPSRLRATDIPTRALLGRDHQIISEPCVLDVRMFAAVYRLFPCFQHPIPGEVRRG